MVAEFKVSSKITSGVIRLSSDATDRLINKLVDAGAIIPGRGIFAVRGKKIHGLKLTADEVAELAAGISEHEAVDKTADEDAAARAILRETLNDVAALEPADRHQVLCSLAKSRAKLKGGDLVRTIRRQTGTTLTDLKDKFGIRAATVSNIENAKNANGPDLWSLELLAHAMGKRLKIEFEDID